MLLTLIAFLLLACSTSAQSACAGGIPTSEVIDILDAHNNLRRTISNGTFIAKDKLMPPAYGSGIPNLVWDCGIEQSAQNHSNVCKFEHSTGTVKPKLLLKVQFMASLNNIGENMYMMASSRAVSIVGQGKAASDSWAQEFQDNGWSDIKFTIAVANSGIGHATQMAWEKTTKIGCGMAKCNGEKSLLVTCQYKVAGNYIGEYVYTPKNQW